MALTDNDQLQEAVLLVGDKMSLVNKKWWYALAITIVVIAPIYSLAKLGFVALTLKKYQSPSIIYSDQPKQPLKIKSTGIFDLGNNNYSGYVKIENTEHDWGVGSQDYKAEFKTFGGTIVATFNNSTFILPSSEKLVVFRRFEADKKPDVIVFSLGETHFIRKPDVEFDPELQRLTILNPLSGLVVSAGIKNTTAFTISQIDLPITVFDSNNQIVAVNYTYVSDILSGETRSFQYSWPMAIPGNSALRAEIKPEINIFNRDIFQIPTGVSPFDNTRK